ncbi:MAG: FAD binding domain-containing protein [Bacilli bacterium]|nr:FAD binding domain-containing protein [Bacilli bacterium]MBN2877468.1 FAD binding domain-containing protein [Bacilli bacterium]
MVNGYLPTTLKEALELLNEHNLRIVAGGTDMLVQHHNLKTLPIDFKQDVLYIANIPELQGITEDDEYIRIGACEPLESILEHPATPKLLKDTIIEMASPAIRHSGTLGGNIGNASPAGDSLVPLYLMNAALEIQSIEGTRTVDIKEFITGVRKIALKPNELITKIILDKVEFTKAIFKKVGPRRSDAISKLSFAGAITIQDNKITDLRFAFGSVNITVVRHPEIECNYITKTVEELKQSVDDIVGAYQNFIRPIDDQRSNKAYRKQVSLNLLRDFIVTL